MFGKNFTVDLEYDSHQLLFIISDFLKEKGISYFNTIEGNKLRGNGDAGMGIFEIEKVIDRDKNLKLFVEANSNISAEILTNLITMALEHVEENNLFDKSIVQIEEVEDKEIDLENEEKDEDSKIKKCHHEYENIKEEEFMGIDIIVYHCKKCNKLEFFKN